VHPLGLIAFIAGSVIVTAAKSSTAAPAPPATGPAATTQPAAADPAARAKVTIVQTPHGMRVAYRGKPPAAPAPTLFVFFAAADTSLSLDDLTATARLLEPHGFFIVAVDAPCHGDQIEPGDTGANALESWALRFGRGNNFMPGYAARVSKAIDYLIEQGWSDPRRIAVLGESRGGFIAMHVAAADPRVACAVAASPVTDPRALAELKGLEKNAVAEAASLVNLADRLATRPLFLIIGPQDTRVDTSSAVTFAMRVISAATEQNLPARITLHVMPAPDHHSPAGHNELEARFILDALRRRP
jgi:dienelactone hydrolase